MLRRTTSHEQVAAGPSALFVACGTGEFTALRLDEYRGPWCATAVARSAGRLPVFAGCRRRPADGARIRPGGRRVRRGRAAAAAAVPGHLHAGRSGAARAPTWPRPPRLPIIVYQRANAVLDPAAAVALLDLPTVVGIKDGRGDVDAMLRLVTAVRASGHRGPPSSASSTACRPPRCPVQAYRAIGVDSYSSAVLCFVPDIATAFYRAVESGDDDRSRAPCWPSSTCRSSRCATGSPGYAVSLVEGRRDACAACRWARSARRWSTPRPGARRAARRAHRPGPGGAARVDAPGRAGGSRMRSPITRSGGHPDRLPRPAAAQLGRRAPAVGAARRSSRCAAATARSASARPTATPRTWSCSATVAPALDGLDLFDLTGLLRRVGGRARRRRRARPARADRRRPARQKTAGPGGVARSRWRCLDLQGQAIGRPVWALLGGKVRDTVPFSGVPVLQVGRASRRGAGRLRRGARPGRDRRPGPADGRPRTASSSIKLKGGVFPPDEEIAAIRALREAFPEHPLRLDPNAAWTVETSLRGRRADRGLLEYLEDPTPGLAGMAEVAARAPMPLATNMCVVEFGDLPEPVRRGLGADRARRPPLLGRAAPQSARAGRDLPHLGHRAVHALQQPPGDQPRRDDPPRRRHARPDLRRGHPHAVAAAASTWWPSRCRFVGRRGGRAGGPGPRRDPRPGRAGPAARELPARAASANATTPATCARFQPDYEKRRPRW